MKPNVKKPTKKNDKPSVVQHMEKSDELKKQGEKKPRPNVLTAASITKTENRTLAQVLKNAPSGAVIVVRNNELMERAMQSRVDCDVRVKESLTVDALWRNRK